MFLIIFANNQNEEKMKENGHQKPQRAVIMGASSGIGYALAQRLIAHGWTVGLAARRTQPLQQLQQQAPERCFYAPIDVTDAHAEAQLLALFQQMGGVDVYVHAAGIGWQNPALVAEKELQTAETNAVGFIRMVGTAYRYFAKRHKGHIVCISSIAGTKGLGPAPAYSATKALQNTYLQALEQLACQQRLNLRSGLCRYTSTHRNDAISHVDASGTRSPKHREGHQTATTCVHHRLAMARGYKPLATDSQWVMALRGAHDALKNLVF